MKNAVICCEHFEDSDFQNDEKKKLKDRKRFPIRWSEQMVSNQINGGNTMEPMASTSAQDNLVTNDTIEVTGDEFSTITNRNDCVKTYPPSKKNA